MAKQAQKTKSSTKADAVEETAATTDTSVRERLIDELDELLDEIDTVLEHTDFVAAFVQKGGE